MEYSEAEPVLKATYQLLRHHDEVPGEAAVSEALGRPPGDEQTARALMYLHDHGFIDGHVLWGNAVPDVVRINATTKGLEVASGWPPEGGGAAQVELLLQLLDELIASDETPEEEKPKLLRIRDGFVGLTRDVGAGLLTLYLARASQLSGG